MGLGSGYNVICKRSNSSGDLSIDLQVKKVCHELAFGITLDYLWSHISLKFHDLTQVVLFKTFLGEKTVIT